MEVSTCAACGGKVGRGLSICPHCYQSMVPSTRPSAGKAPPAASKAPAGPAQGMLMWSVCAALVVGVGYGGWMLRSKAPTSAASISLDGHGQPLALPAIIQQARLSLEKKDFQEAAGQSRLGLSFLNYPADREGQEETAEISLRLILAEARVGQGLTPEAISEYRWLWEHDQAHQTAYAKTIDELTRGIRRRGLEKAQTALTEARALAKRRRTRQALARGADSLGLMQEHAAEPLEVARVSQFLADQHLVLGERDRARTYLQQAAHLGLTDKRLDGLSFKGSAKSGLVSGTGLITSSYQEERLTGTPPGIGGEDPLYPTHRNGESLVKPAKRTPLGAASPAPPRIPSLQPAAPSTPAQRIVLPSLKLPEATRDTLPSYNVGRSGDSLPSYNTRDNGTLPTYNQGDTRRQ